MRLQKLVQVVMVAVFFLDQEAEKAQQQAFEARREVEHLKLESEARVNYTTTLYSLLFFILQYELWHKQASDARRSTPKCCQSLLGGMLPSGSQKSPQVAEARSFFANARLFTKAVWEGRLEHVLGKPDG